MRILRILLIFIFIVSLMLSSCSTPPDTFSLTEEHAYIYHEETLYDLAELEYTDPMFTVECLDLTDKKLYERVINDPAMFIITFTVIDCTVQTNIIDPESADSTGCRLSTKLRVDKIHYLGKDIQLKEGKIYDFMHLGAWILERDGKTMYTIHPIEQHFYAAFKYGCQYVMCGGYDFDSTSYYISNDLGYNENTAPEDIWFLK